MPHDFDPSRRERQAAIEDLDFVLGGVALRRRPTVRPEVMVAFEDLTPGTSAGESLRVMHDLVLAYLEPESQEAFIALRQREEDPITARDLSEVIRWLISGATGRPIGQPSPSTGGSGSGTTGTDSTADSSSEAGEVSAT